MIARYSYIIAFVCLIVVLACDTPSNPEYGSGNPDPNPPGTPAATITAVNPASALPGTPVTITGSGFNTDASANLVSFGPNAATVTSATATQLEVIAPFAAGNVNVKVAVRGSVNWSNELAFGFLSFIPDIATPEVFTVDEETVWPNGIAVDASDNVYFGGKDSAVVFKVTPAGEKSVFAQAPVSGAMHFGSDGNLYACASDDGKIVKISADGSSVEDFVEVDGAVDFDWDENGNMYIVSNDYGIYMLPPGGAVSEVKGDIGSVKNCRVFDGYLYFSRIWDGDISRYEITADGLGDEEFYLDGDTPSSFEFDVNGSMYWAHAWETTLNIYAPGGAEEATIYEEELETPMRYMTFHKDKIYIVFPGWADVGKVIRVHIGVNQAPRY